MRLCLTCYHLWPHEALLCGYCGRSFNGRLCPRRHLSPASARCCIHCGQPALTEPTASLSLGWVSVLLVWGSIWLVLAWYWRRIGPAVEADGVRLLTGAVVIWVMLALVPGSAGRQIRASVGRFLAGLWRLMLFGAGYRVLRDLGRWVQGLLDGRNRRRYH